MSAVQGRGIAEQIRDAYVVEDWDIARLGLGDAIVGLPGVTRRSIIELLKDWGYEVIEGKLAIADVMKAAEEGKLEEVFGTGTAAVVSPVKELDWEGKVAHIGGGGAALPGLSGGLQPLAGGLPHGGRRAPGPRRRGPAAGRRRRLHCGAERRDGGGKHGHRQLLHRRCAGKRRGHADGAAPAGLCGACGHGDFWPSHRAAEAPPQAGPCRGGWAAGF